MHPVLAHAAPVTLTGAMAVVILPLLALTAVYAWLRRGPGPSVGREAAWWVALTTLLGAQFIHWAEIGRHASDWKAAGAFFAGLAILEGLLAAGLVYHRRPVTVWAAVVVSAGTVVLWAVSRTVGLPMGPGAGTAGPVGLPDLVATVFEAATALALVPFLRRGGELDGPPPRPTGGRARSAFVPLAALWVGAATLVALTPAEEAPETAAAFQAASAPEPEGSSPGTVLAGLVARDATFTPSALSLPSGHPIRIQLDNQDGTMHNVSVSPAGPDGKPVFAGSVASPYTTEVYDLDALPAGSYAFSCSLHPSMRGTLTVTSG